MFETIVVGVGEYEAGGDALALAMALAGDKPDITLLHVEVVADATGAQACTAADAERQRFGLERLARLRDEAKAVAKVARIEATSVKAGLHGFAKTTRADLIVVGAEKRDPLAHMFLGEEARKVLEEPPCVVAVAPAGYAASHAQKIRKIGVAYDRSPESERALAFASEIAAERRATVSAFEAVPAPLYARDPWNVEGEIAENVERARRRIAALPEVEAHAEFDDDAVDGLRRFSASVDLLVLGAHEYRLPERLLNRSKSQRLAEEPPSPLLVLAPDTARSAS